MKERRKQTEVGRKSLEKADNQTNDKRKVKHP